MEPLLAAAGLAVFAATVVQTVTGAGLGLIAGPILLLLMGSRDAIQVAIVLNLALSLALLPRERAHLPRRALLALGAGALLGMPLGLLALHAVDVLTLKLIAGLAVTGGGLQMLLARRRGQASGGDAQLPWFGGVAGAMTAALAIPGPVALWGLSRTALDNAEVRATLRAFFVFAYSACLLSHTLTGMRWPAVLQMSGWLAAPLLAGMALGVFLERYRPEAWLRTAFMVLVLAMGCALLGEVAWSLVTRERAIL